VIASGAVVAARGGGRSLFRLVMALAVLCVVLLVAAAGTITA
jgi:hypothetical protein